MSPFRSQTGAGNLPYPPHAKLARKNQKSVPRASASTACPFAGCDRENLTVRSIAYHGGRRYRNFGKADLSKMPGTRGADQTLKGPILLLIYCDIISLYCAFMRLFLDLLTL
jgi:hypothetical protein